LKEIAPTRTHILGLAKSTDPPESFLPVPLCAFYGISYQKMIGIRSRFPDYTFKRSILKAMINLNKP
jgi:hypothetical protein